ncbi:MAG TPA: ATP-binding protein [Burkholderiaceae bacterium]
MRKRGSSRDDAALPDHAIPVRAELTQAVRTGRDRVAASEGRRLADAVLDSSGLLIVLLDLESRVVRANRAYCEFVGLSDAAAVGRIFPVRPASEKDVADDEQQRHTAYAAWFAALTRGDETVVWEQALPGDPGAPHRAARRIAWRGSRTPGADGQPQGLMLLIGVDVTAQRRIEDDAPRRRARAAQMHRLHLANELAGAFGHELSQPLAAMVAFADVAVQRHARAGGAANEDAVVEFEEIATQARRAAQALAALRRFVALGGSEPSCESDLNALVRSACGLVQDDAQTGGVVLECELAQAPVPVLAEPWRLEHALVNLIGNAIDATAQRPGGTGGVVRVVVQPLQAGTTAGVDVLDNGPGIAADRLEQVFKPFYTTKANALGLGLRIARTVVEAHGGRLWAEASANGGIFRITLPMLEAGDTGSRSA